MRRFDFIARMARQAQVVEICRAALRGGNDMVEDGPCVGDGRDVVASMRSGHERRPIHGDEATWVSTIWTFTIQSREEAERCVRVWRIRVLSAFLRSLRILEFIALWPLVPVPFQSH